MVGEAELEARPSLTREVAPSHRVLQVVVILGTLLALAALTILGLRATQRMDPSWDSLAYHLPFAAYRAGVDIPFQMDDRLVPLYEGAPPLPELAMGVIWRATDSIASVGLANYLAFALFIAWCALVLRASFWVVTLVSLTAPLVIIHTSVAYIDLLTNVFLALGAVTLVHLWLYPERASRLALVGGLLGLAAACWSKYTMTPFAGVLFLLYVPVAWRALGALRWGRATVLIVIVGAAAVAALPYIRNLMEYGNPFWPFRTPIIGSLFPYEFDNDSPSRPPALVGASSIEAFVRSLFEIDLPWSYANRTRWAIDAGGDVGEAFRMGGFWGIGSLFYLCTMFGLLWVAEWRGRVVAVAGLVTLALIALIPQANELRYWMFIPLMWAAIIGMLFRPLSARHAGLAVVLGVTIIGMFTYIVAENRVHYSPRPYGWMDAAQATGAADRWSLLRSGETYCAVGMMPMPLLLTGPTHSEFEIVDRRALERCPAGAIVLTHEGVGQRVGEG